MGTITLIGEVLHGNRIVNTAYKVSVLDETPCTEVCKAELDTTSKFYASTFRLFILNV